MPAIILKVHIKQLLLRSMIYCPNGYFFIHVFHTIHVRIKTNHCEILSVFHYCFCFLIISRHRNYGLSNTKVIVITELTDIFKE